MERMATLKSLCALALLASSFSVFAQDYNNIEFIENKGQWDPHVKFKGEVSSGAVFIRSTGVTFLQHNQDDYATLQSLEHNRTHISAAMASRTPDRVRVRSHAYNIDFIGASSQMEVVPDKEIPSYNNYFIGNDRQSGLPSAGSTRVSP